MLFPQSLHLIRLFTSMEFKWHFLTSSFAGQLLWPNTNLPPECRSVICIFCSILKLSLKDVKGGIFLPAKEKHNQKKL